MTKRCLSTCLSAAVCASVSAALLLLPSTELQAQKKTKISLRTNTGFTVGKKKPERKQTHKTEASSAALDSIIFSGYDKTLTSTKESVLVSNRLEAPVESVRIRIDYLDAKGRMLHSRTVTLKTDVPPGETRKLDFRSWDNQQTYFYCLGPEPRRTATPYSVKIKLLNAVLTAANPVEEPADTVHTLRKAL